MRKWIFQKYRHNKEFVFALAVLVVAFALCYGCESKGPSIIDSSVKVTKETLEQEKASELKRLNSETEAIERKYQLSKDEIAKWDALKQFLFEQTTITTADPETGEITIEVNSEFDPMKILLGIGNIFGLSGIGLAMRRGSVINSKDKEIKTLKGN